MKPFFILVFILSSIFSYSQNSILKALKSQLITDKINFGGSIMDKNKNILINGSIEEQNPFHFYPFLAKLDSALNLIWIKSYPTGSDGGFYSIELLDDGNYLMTGKDNLSISYSLSDSTITGSNSIFIVKTDTSGDILWNSKLEGQEALTSCMTKNGDLLIAGMAVRQITPTTSQSDMFAAKIDNSGNLIANYSISQNAASIGEGVYAIKETMDHGIIITGTAQKNSGIFGQINSELFLVKMDSLFNIQWSKSFYGGINGLDANRGIEIFLTADSGFVISGNTTQYYAQPFPMLMKVDKNGNFIWGKLLDFCNTNWGDSQIKTIKYKSGFISFFTEISAIGNTSPMQCLLQSDSLGNSINKKLYIRDSLSYPESSSVIQTGDSDFVCINDARPDNKKIYLLKTSLKADPCTIFSFTLCDSSFIPNERNIYLSKIPLMGFGRLTITPQQINFNDSIICSSSLIFIDDVQIDNSIADIFPNPAQTSFTIQLTSQSQINQIEIFNVLGKRIYTINSEEKSVLIDCSGFVSGVYFVHIFNKKDGVVRKLVVR